MPKYPINKQQQTKKTQSTTPQQNMQFVIGKDIQSLKYFQGWYYLSTAPYYEQMTIPIHYKSKGGGFRVAYVGSMGEKEKAFKCSDERGST